MKSPVIKRSIVIAKHKTSVSIEDLFWSSLKRIAIESGSTLSNLVGVIDHERATGNLSSAIRTFVLRHYRRRCGEADALPGAARLSYALSENGRGNEENAAGGRGYASKFDSA